MKRSIVVLALIGLVVASPMAAAADKGLQIRPLSYTTTLQPGERQQGVVDIANPSDQPITITVSVKGFRQGSDGVEFYDDQHLASGIKLDHDRLSLGGKEAYRLVFEADATKLPSGEVRAAVLFTTVSESEMLAQQVSMGTLLLIDNQQPATAVPMAHDLGVFARYVLVGASLGLLLALGVEAWRRRHKKLALKR